MTRVAGVRSTLAGLLLAGWASAASSVPPVCPPSRDWHAWIDLMPGSGRGLALFVSGEVDVPAGMVAKVRRGPLDRAMSPTQRVTLALQRGKGEVGRQIVTASLRTKGAFYREVIVTCGGQQVARIAGDSIETAD